MRVLWTLEAEHDRIEIWDSVAADDPSAAARMDQLFGEVSARLANFPMPGHVGMILGTRELIPHENDRLVYEIETGENTVWVLALVHTARQWPPVTE